jgi:ankyrin repeat protein
MPRIHLLNAFIDNFECAKMRPLEVSEKLHSFYLYISARGANVNKVNSKGYTPLHDAVKRGDLEVVTELLAYGADSALDVKAGSV